MERRHKLDFESINPYDDESPFFIRMEHIGRYRWAREMLRRKKSKRILDIACADGYGTSQLFAEGRFVLGADRKKKSIDKAKKQYQNCQFITLDIDRGNSDIKEAAPFDAICCFETLEHLKYPLKALKLFYEVMSAGGILMLSLPDGDFEPKDKNGVIKSDFHLHAFSQEDIMAMLDKSGFSLTKILHQHMPSRLHRNFNTAIRDQKISVDDLNAMFPEDNESLDILSEIFAWPDEVKGKSYSTIYLCVKNDPL